MSTFGEKPFKVPGPGNYHAKYNYVDEASPKVSLASRHLDVSDKWALSVPGPGSYKTIELLDKNLKSNVSRF